MNVTLSRKIVFSSAHRYVNPDFSEAQNIEAFGACYNEHGHGHNYVLEAYLNGPISKQTGMVINLKEVDSILKEVIAPFDHHHLNFDIEEFKTAVPTTENIATLLFKKLSIRFSQLNVTLAKVRLYEGDDLWVDVWG